MSSYFLERGWILWLCGQWWKLLLPRFWTSPSTDLEASDSCLLEQCLGPPCCEKLEPCGEALDDDVQCHKTTWSGLEWAHSQWNLHLQSQCPILECQLVYSIVPLWVQLSANRPRKASADDTSTWTLPPTGKTLTEFQDPAFNLDQPWQLQLSGKQTNRWKIFTVLSLCASNFFFLKKDLYKRRQVWKKMKTPGVWVRNHHRNESFYPNYPNGHHTLHTLHNRWATLRVLPGFLMLRSESKIKSLL